MVGDSKVDGVVLINNFAYLDAIKQLFSKKANFEIIKNNANTTSSELFT